MCFYYVYITNYQAIMVYVFNIATNNPFVTYMEKIFFDCLSGHTEKCFNFFAIPPSHDDLIPQNNLRSRHTYKKIFYPTQFECSKKNPRQQNI